MSRYVLSPRARLDIADIWDYTAEHWGVDQAEEYVRMLQQTIETLTRERYKGRSIEDVRSEYRKYPAGSHVIFYRMKGEHIEVVRILHRRMDVERHLSD
jgi:toxin ParE1/3/4